MKISIGNGTYKIGDKTFEIAGLPCDEYKLDATIDDSGNVQQIDGFTKYSFVIIDNKIHIAITNDANIIRDGNDWKFDGKNLLMTPHRLQRLEMIRLIRKYDKR